MIPKKPTPPLSAEALREKVNEVAQVLRDFDVQDSKGSRVDPEYFLENFAAATKGEKIDGQDPIIRVTKSKHLRKTMISLAKAYREQGLTFEIAKPDGNAPDKKSKKKSFLERLGLRRSR